MKIGDRVVYFTDSVDQTGTVTDLYWFEGILIAEVDSDYTCFAGDLVGVDDA